MTDQVEETGVDSPDEVAKATRAGWAPREKWKGNPDAWVSAAEFNRRADEVLPIVKAQKRELEEALEAERRAGAQRDSELRALKASLKTIEENQAKDISERAAALREELIDAIAQASEAGEHRKLAKLTADLSQLDAAQTKAKDEREVETRQQAQRQQDIDPAAKAAYDNWASRNPWFAEGGQKSRIALGLAQALRASQPNLTLARFYAMLDEDLIAAGIVSSPAVEKGGDSRVAGGRPSGSEGGGGSGNGKSYGDLPPDAKAECDRQGKRYGLVGKGKRYENESQWRAAYAKTYFSME